MEENFQDSIMDIIKTCDIKIPEIQNISQVIVSKTERAIAFQKRIEDLAKSLRIDFFKYLNDSGYDWLIADSE